ncbi:hypothetical protein SARC_17699, partial [Sphaeroforma arctica JP610]
AVILYGTNTRTTSMPLVKAIPTASLLWAQKDFHYPMHLIRMSREPFLKGT